MGVGTQMYPLYASRLTGQDQVAEQVLIQC
jgi:hypothetical protein